jgi:tRNA 2-thiouridine synthesizing protein A
VYLSNREEPTEKIDCSGKCCSLPLVEARMQLDKIQVGDELEVVATCPSSEKDMEILTRLEQFELVQSWKKEEKYQFIIKK